MPIDYLQQFWDDLLSRQPERIRESFAGLDADTRQAVIEHLNRMASEEGWHPSQKESAQIALQAISHSPGDPSSQHETH